jgi:hypothetical protein
MAQVRKALPVDFDAVLPLLRGFRTDHYTDEQWQRLFTPHWGAPDDPCGYLMEDNGTVVGFLGTVFSQRNLQGKSCRFCNMAAWIVKEEYRSESMGLLFPLLGQKDLTITNFTANHRVVDVLRHLGFKDLETSLYFLYPRPAFGGAACRVITGQEEMRARLDEAGCRIWDDHAGLHCQQAVLELNGQVCHIVINYTKKKRLPVAYIDYISDPAVFAACIRSAALRLCLHWRVAALMIGEHSLQGLTLPGARPTPRRHPLLFRSSCLQAGQIDTLYTEIQLLGLLPM